MANIGAYDRWLTTLPDDEEEIRCCDWCGESLYMGDTYYDMNGEYVCENCIDDCKKEIDDSDVIEPDWDSMPGGYDE